LACQSCSASPGRYSERPVLRIADIADALDMSRSTTHRYVLTLTALGYLEWLSRKSGRALGASVDIV
jgi:DNA-binding IclR family transcriptional regulator